MLADRAPGACTHLLGRVALVAGDDGARAAVAPLIAFGARWTDPDTSTRALACGTSQSDEGFAREAIARRRAAAAGIPLICIEDFPGNYQHVAGAPPRLLVVEGEFSARLYTARLGAQAPAMVIVPPARYDAMRGPARPLAPAGPPWRVLWAGQPETSACLATLHGLMPFLAAADIELLFRAHPRDSGVASGVYRPIEGALGHRWRDVTGIPLDAVFAMKPHLVLTQYSSVAVEAGFAGIPAVFVLFPDAGGALLHAQKGYRVPMPCAEGAAFLVERPDEIATLDQALRDVAARRAVLERFRNLYRADTPQAPLLAERVAAIIVK